MLKVYIKYGFMICCGIVFKNIGNDKVLIFILSLGIVIYNF